MVQFEKHRFVTAVLWGLLLILAACRPLSNEPAGQVEAVDAVEPTATTLVEVEFMPALTDMRDIADLQADFNAYPDVPRLILLLSPT